MSNNVKIIKPIVGVLATPGIEYDLPASSLYDTRPQIWNSGTYYNAPVFNPSSHPSLYEYVSVDGLLGEILIYRSLQGTNQNHPPATSPTWWEYSSSCYQPFIQGTNYSFGYRVYDSVTKNIYESLTANNTAVLDIVNNPPWLSIGTRTSTLPSVWSSGTSYSIGTRVYYTATAVNTVTGTVEIIIQGVYESVTNANLNNLPDNNLTYWNLIKEFPVPWQATVSYIANRIVYLSNDKLYTTVYGNKGIVPSDTYTPLWLKISPSNLSAPFDDETSTGCSANKYLYITAKTGVITSAGLIGVNADSAKITVRNGYGGTIVFQKTIGLSGGNASNGWDYYFTDASTRKSQAYISGIPPYNNAHLTVELSGSGTIGLGNLILGSTKELGIPENGLSSEMLDYSKKTTDDFGRTTFVKRGFKRTLDLNMFVDNANISRVESLLEDVRATPILVIASEDPDYSETAIRYCFYKTFRTEISYPTFAYVSIQFEGLI